MRKQTIQFLTIVGILILCAIIYFGTTLYFSKQEEAESADTITAFEIEDYKNNITKVSYGYSDEDITLVNEDGTWYDSADKSVKIDSSAVETMTALLSNVTASQKIEKPDDISEYGFTTDDDGNIEATTNKIVITDADEKTYTLYIGASNPYDESQYYLMVEGDDNIYVVDSTLSEGFEKSIDDLTEEETTVEETTVEETTAEEASSVQETETESTTES
jgi:hypothetical protein